jgi:hypothetical protein
MLTPQRRGRAASSQKRIVEHQENKAAEKRTQITKGGGNARFTQAMPTSVLRLLRSQGSWRSLALSTPHALELLLRVPLPPSSLTLPVRLTCVG